MPQPTSFANYFASRGHTRILHHMLQRVRNPPRDSDQDTRAPDLTTGDVVTRCRPSEGQAPPPWFGDSEILTGHCPHVPRGSCSCRASHPSVLPATPQCCLCPLGPPKSRGERVAVTGPHRSFISALPPRAALGPGPPPWCARRAGTREGGREQRNGPGPHRRVRHSPIRQQYFLLHSLPHAVRVVKELPPLQVRIRTVCRADGRNR
jgi:hypothetical protein